MRFAPVPKKNGRKREVHYSAKWGCTFIEVAVWPRGPTWPGGAASPGVMTALSHPDKIVPATPPPAPPRCAPKILKCGVKLPESLSGCVRACLFVTLLRVPIPREVKRKRKRAKEGENTAKKVVIIGSFSATEPAL